MASEVVNPMMKEEPERLARASDPSTSHRAAQIAAIRGKSQKALLLLAYQRAEESGLTDEEAGASAGLSGSGYWKRCSELRTLGLIAPSGKERQASSGLMVQVCSITLAGMRALS
jgi:hypothetical protein